MVDRWTTEDGEPWIRWKQGMTVDFFWVPSGYVKIAIEHGPFIVDFPIKHGDFP